MKRKKRILQINKLYYPFIGGIECVVQQIAEGLNGSMDMLVLVCNTEGKTVRERVHGVRVIRTGSQAMLGNLPLSAGYLREFRRQARRSDVLLFHAPFPIGDLVYLLSGVRGRKVVLWWHSDIVRQKKLLLLYRPLMKWFLRKVDTIVVATEGHIEGSQFLKPFREKCVVIPFGIRQEIERDSKRYLEEQSRQETGTGQAEELSGEQAERGRLRFLFVGRLVYYKGCDVLLKAFAKVADAELTVIGSGPLEADMRRFVKEHRLTGRVHFKTDLSDGEVMREYRACDVFVLPSVARSEAFGLVQIEAMAYGKPVINTDLPSGVPYVSLDGVTGITVKPKSVKELTEAMQRMVREPDLRRQMGLAARERVEQEYLEGTMLERLKKVL